MDGFLFDTSSAFTRTTDPAHFSIVKLIFNGKAVKLKGTWKYEEDLIKRMGKTRNLNKRYCKISNIV